jgi:uncharacterized membrane protein (UPF0127 family)
MGRTAHQPLRLTTADGQRVLISRVEVADSLLGRLRGLMGRSNLAPDEGLYLPGTNSIHMLFMRFPIDILFLGKPAADGALPVLGVRHRLRPWRGVVWWVRGAKGAIELTAGALEATGVKVGDRVRLEQASS